MFEDDSSISLEFNDMQGYLKGAMIGVGCGPCPWQLGRRAHTPDTATGCKGVATTLNRHARKVWLSGGRGWTLDGYRGAGRALHEVICVRSSSRKEGGSGCIMACTLTAVNTLPHSREDGWCKASVQQLLRSKQAKTNAKKDVALARIQMESNARAARAEAKKADKAAKMDLARLTMQQEHEFRMVQTASFPLDNLLCSVYLLAANIKFSVLLNLRGPAGGW
ncbi:hypothetical protein B0H10DRAFT_1960630 [Mycena sp. CBHHK59/15]|nr:hypothetical protein B0H10DRAFT_1960630 [Mycena sp. CBHHK59/15]